MRSRLLVVTAALAAGALAPAASAVPWSDGSTAVTFTLSGDPGGLAISVADSAFSIATTGAGASSVSGSLGIITVTDPRGSLAATWTATVSATDFITGTGTADETVVRSGISYSSGPGSALAGQVGAMAPSLRASLGSSAAAARWTGVGDSTVTWNPTLTFALLASQVAGTYAGAITHSVA